MRGIFRLVAIIVFFFLPLSSGIGFTAGRLWQLLTVTLILMAISLLPTARIAHRHYWGVAAVASFFGVALSTLRTLNVTEHLQAGILLIGLVAFAPLACARLLLAYSSMRKELVIAFISGQSLSAVIAIAQTAGMGVFQLSRTNGRSYGLAGHPNLLGLMSGIAICLLTYVILRKSRKKNSKFKLLLLLVNVAGLLLSGSVSALIATTLGVLILVHALKVRISTVLLYTTGLAVVSATYLSLSRSITELPNPFERVQQVTGNTGDIGTWDVRTQVYGYALTEIIKNPLVGVGVDDESGLFQHPLDGAVLVHNVLLRGWLQGGLLVLIALLAIYMAAISAVISCRRFGYNEASCAALTTTLAFALTSAAFHQPYFWVLVAMAWATLKPESASRYPAKRYTHLKSRTTTKNLTRHPQTFSGHTVNAEHASSVR